jgi:hypothetical protein
VAFVPKLRTLSVLFHVKLDDPVIAPADPLVNRTDPVANPVKLIGDIVEIEPDTESDPVISEFPCERKPFFITNSLGIISFPYPRLC